MELLVTTTSSAYAVRDQLLQWSIILVSTSSFLSPAESESSSMAKRQHPCSTPRIRWRDRPGTVWRCDCGQTYYVYLCTSFGDSLKVWKELD